MIILPTPLEVSFLSAIHLLVPHPSLPSFSAHPTTSHIFPLAPLHNPPHRIVPNLFHTLAHIKPLPHPSSETHHSPKRRLQSPLVILPPPPLRPLLLPHRHTHPARPHNGHRIHIILIKVQGQRRKVSLGPSRQSPPLHDLGRFLQAHVLALDTSSKQSELASGVCALEGVRWGASEGGEAGGVGEGGVELGGGGAEFGGRGEGGGVYGWAVGC